MKNMRHRNRNRHKPTLRGLMMIAFSPILRWVDFEKLRIRRKQLSQIPWGVLGILTSIAVITTIWSVIRTGDYEGLALNFGTEMAGAIITYLLLEIFIGTNQKRQLLISQLTSKSIDIAINAIEEIVRNDWHADGSMNNAFLGKLNLPSAEIHFANFENSELVESNFKNANLYRSNLQWALLQRADFTNADLSFSRFSYADLIDCNLSYANLFHADFSRSHLGSVNLQNANLTDANLESADLFRADLRGANLKNANLINTHLRDAIYNNKTEFPHNFNPIEAGMIEVEKPEDFISSF